LANLKERQQDWIGVAHALVEVCDVPQVNDAVIINSANRMLGLLALKKIQIDTAEKKILVNRIISKMNERFQGISKNLDALVAMAWLYLHMGEKNQAKAIVKKVIKDNPSHGYGLNLARKMGIKNIAL